uniref:Zinc finger C2HC domain-containing protein 1A n=1 Tax=Cyprinodon variegatus TaxID=28743 RepID=A0A3Q2DPI6_CYPVA
MSERSDAAHGSIILFFQQEKHAKICQKAATKRRKVFDSSRQRAEGTDISTLKPIKPKPPKKPSNWRKKHEDFIATIRAAKAATQVVKEGGALPPPPPPSYDPDYIQCPCCQRRFNQNAADRHIKFCQEQAARMPNKNKSGDAKKPPSRTQVHTCTSKKEKKISKTIRGHSLCFLKNQIIRVCYSHNLIINTKPEKKAQFRKTATLLLTKQISFH